MKFVRYASLNKKSVQYIRKRLLGSSAYRLWDSVKMYLIEKGSEGVL
jgi:hypothetical protein